MDNTLHLQPLDQQIQGLLEILRANSELMRVLQLARELHVSDWYVGAGAIVQTVWNHFHQFPLQHGIKDYDLVYFDPDTSYQAEDAYIQKGKEVFADISLPVEIRNQARVHLWYKKHFGYDITPYVSSEQAITTWPTTSTTIGVRLNASGAISIYAPFGLHDLLAMIVKPNKVKITEKIYLDKVNRWQPVWPQLKIIPW